ncbi:MAG: helix-turn-helix domain-containing protein [Deltaproteobacteria bacterium]|nr:helix-turn-helix domain-containing protein [Deltaproteobacteria bacterium]
MPQHEPFVGAPQAARFLNLTVPAIYEAVRRKELPAYRLGQRRLRFRLDELDRLAQRTPMKSNVSLGPGSPREVPGGLDSKALRAPITTTQTDERRPCKDGAQGGGGHDTDPTG